MIATCSTGNQRMGWLTSLAIGVGIYMLLRKKHRGPLNEENQDDDLINIRIVHNGEHYAEQTKNKEEGRWVKPGEMIEVDKFKISRGFFYVGGQLKSLNGYDTESSLVDPTLRINVEFPDYSGELMNYWPSYSHISPESRAAYVEWLASNRNNPETDIGYVFLYFYGIERRLLVDDKDGAVSGDERRSLIQELERLKNIYSDNRSFNGYVTSLLSHVWVINHQNDHRKPSCDLLVAKRNFTSAFKFLLGTAVKNGKAIDAELALAWVRSHPEFSLRTPARRCKNEFSTLFKLRYRGKFGDGLEIAPNKTKLRLDYYPASSSLRGYQSIKLDLPDPSRLKAPVKKLMDLAESCTNELEPFSRFIGRSGNSRDSFIAISLLPKDLAVSHSQFERLKTWMNDRISSSDGLISVESILGQLEDCSFLRINKKEAELLADITEKTGFGIAPDIRFHQAKPDINGKAVIFPGGHGNDFFPSPEFRKVGTILRLGSLVAKIDDHVDRTEADYLMNVIKQNERLTEIEKRSLCAYMKWRLNTPANMNGLKKRLESLDKSEKAAIGHILIGVALADGKIDPVEIKQIEKLYTSLGLDKSTISSDIHNLSSPKRPGDGIPRGGQKTSLDHELLKQYEKETREVRVVLESIFEDETTVEESESEKKPDTDAPDGAIPRLDTKHQDLYNKLIVKEKWSFEEVAETCKGLQLMPDGAVEEINEWTFEIVDAPLIEDGSTIFYIDLEVAKEIAELQMQYV